ncbi:MAG: galactokinase [Longimicrobiales bacterium]
MAKENRKREMEEGRTAFMECYDGRVPTHYTRAPGRVNLVGEHTDYNGLPVLPMALEQEVRVFFRPRADAVIHVAGFHREFTPRRFMLSDDIPRSPPGDWGNYLKAPCQALCRRLDLDRGFDALVQSTVPVASGLSSSSALVNAMGVTLLQVNGTSLPTLDLAEEMARAERYTGTRGGGMDQAISLGARAGHASRIEFRPLRMFEKAIPRDWYFVVAHTLVRAEKSGGARAAYNRRREECDRALSVMGRTVAREDGGPPSYPELLRGVPLEELLRLARTALPPLLLKRFRHVVTEAHRVYQAEEAMEKGDTLAFGILMDASHESLKGDYEVSSPELDRLVGLARKAGAAGARLTGAGFGGCVVALSGPDRLDRVLGTLREGYYMDRSLSGPLDRFLFVAEASPGASVHPL